MPLHPLTKAVALASVPFALGSFVWRALSTSRDLEVDLDPFEIDLQLRERNDD